MTDASVSSAPTIDDLPGDLPDDLPGDPWQANPWDGEAGPPDALGDARIGGDDGILTVLAVGLSDAVRERLETMGSYELVDDAGDPQPPDVALVSTRLPRAELMGKVLSLRDRCPMVVLAHTGGERLALDVVRAGARGVVAEGNERVLRAFLSSEAHDTGLLEVYERQLGQQRARAEVRRSQDAVTGLPTGSSFEARLADATLSGDIPRVGFLRILHLDTHDGRTSREVVRLVRKRLAMQFTAVARTLDVELFSLDVADIGLIGASLSPAGASQLGARLARIVQDFSPNGTPLALALGHAGEEVSSDPTVVRQLAQRAMEMAALEQRSNVVAADTLALGISSTTELEAALHILGYVEERSAAPVSGEEVAEVAADLAWELGFEGPARTTIQLAAHLHGLGKASLPVEAMDDDGELSPDLLALHRSHPARGADYLRPLAGTDVAEAVQWHRERWDGSGFPDGLRGDEIPMAARIIAIARSFTEAGGVPGGEQAMRALSEEAGRSLDPGLVDMVLPLLARRLVVAQSAG